MAVGSTIYIPGSAGVGKYLNTILSGKAAPDDSQGSRGDFFLDTRPGVYRLYGPKQGEKWPAFGVSLIGPAGSGEGAGGNRIFFGDGPPSDDLLPNANDVYFDRLNQTIYNAS